MVFVNTLCQPVAPQSKALCGSTHHKSRFHMNGSRPLLIELTSSLAGNNRTGSSWDLCNAVRFENSCSAQPRPLVLLFPWPAFLYHFVNEVTQGTIFAEKAILVVCNHTFLFKNPCVTLLNAQRNVILVKNPLYVISMLRRSLEYCATVLRYRYRRV